MIITAISFAANKRKFVIDQSIVNDRIVISLDDAKLGVCDAEDFTITDIDGMTEYIWPNLNWNEPNPPVETLQIAKLVSLLSTF